jgi:hypothetical protein
MKSGSMRLDFVKGKKTYFSNTVEMKTLCMQSIRKLESKMGQLLVCPVLLRIVFPTVPPYLMMIMWFLQFAVNIQNPRESLGMIMMKALSTFLDILLHKMYKMRELAQISFLREILWSMLLRELQYLMHLILVQGLIGMLANILLPNGCVVLTENWNALILVSLNSRKLWVNSTNIYLL